MPDIKKKCIDCGAEFIYSEKDQEFFKEKGLHEPKRCKPCRAAKRQAQRTQGG